MRRRCASEMELPLGEDSNDVDINKVVRRLDKHTAALLGFALGGMVVPNFDLYPEARTTEGAFAKGKARQERRHPLHPLHPLQARQERRRPLCRSARGGSFGGA